VWPLFGPQAGGTLVTVTGAELTDLSDQTVIAFFSSNTHRFITLSTNVTQDSLTSNRYITFFVVIYIYNAVYVGLLCASSKIVLVLGDWVQS